MKFALPLPLLLPLLLLVAIAPPAAAQADDCASAGSQAAMDVCAATAYEKTDAEMNAVYSRLMARLKDDPHAARLLLTAQKHWLAFRDAKCAPTTSASPRGRVRPMLASRCLDGLTRRRIEELEAYRRCQKGDLSCAVLRN